MSETRNTADIPNQVGTCTFNFTEGVYDIAMQVPEQQCKSYTLSLFRLLYRIALATRLVHEAVCAQASKVRSQRSAVPRSLVRATAMPNDGEIAAKLKKQIIGHIQQTYCGDTSDIEGQASTDFCTYFVQSYADKKPTLKG